MLSIFERVALSIATYAARNGSPEFVHRLRTIPTQRAPRPIESRQIADTISIFKGTHDVAVVDDSLIVSPRR